MQREDGRYCDACWQKLPPGAKLAHERVTADEARDYGSKALPNEDGTVTIDLCLACRIRRAERVKGRG